MRGLSLIETCLALLVLLSLPPGLFGHNHATPALLLAAATTLWVCLRGRLHPLHMRPQVLLWFALFHCYLLIAHFVIEPGSVILAIYGLLIAATGCLLLLALLHVCRLRQLLLAFLIIHAAIAVSNIATSVAILLGLEPSLQIAALPIKGYHDAWVRVCLPWTLYYDQIYAVAGLHLQRAIGLYREPGLYQAFGLSAAALAWISPLRGRSILSLVLLLGSFLAISTAWFASLIAILLWTGLLSLSSMRLRRQIPALLGLALTIGALLVARDLPVFGFSDKLAGESGQDRIAAFSGVLPALSENPLLGLGQSTRLQGRVITSNTGSFVVGIARIGFLGTFLFGIAVVQALRRSSDLRGLIVALPLLVTTLTSQPLYYSCLLIAVLLLPVRDLTRAWSSEDPAIDLLDPLQPALGRDSDVRS